METLRSAHENFWSKHLRIGTAVFLAVAGQLTLLSPVSAQSSHFFHEIPYECIVNDESTMTAKFVNKDHSLPLVISCRAGAIASGNIAGAECDLVAGQPVLIHVTVRQVSEEGGLSVTGVAFDFRKSDGTEVKDFALAFDQFTAEHVYPDGSLRLVLDGRTLIPGAVITRLAIFGLPIEGAYDVYVNDVKVGDLAASKNLFHRLQACPFRVIE